MILPKRLLMGALFLTMLINFDSCATAEKTQDSYESRYKIASDECIRFGLRRGSYDYNQCIERKMNSGQ